MFILNVLIYKISYINKIIRYLKVNIYSVPSACRQAAACWPPHAVLYITCLRSVLTISFT